MKKIFTFLLTAFSVANAYCQTPCVPNAQTVPNAKSYIIPDSATGLKHACIGMLYEETIYIKAFKDTSIASLGMTGVSDSLVVDLSTATIGLPPYLVATSVPAAKPANSKHNFPHLLLKGDSIACIKISGTVPTTETPGSTGLSIPIFWYGKIGPTGFPIIDTNFSLSYDNYNYTVDAAGVGNCIPASTNDVQNAFINASITPNQLDQNASIRINTLNNDLANIYITNTSGQIVYSRVINIIAGENTFPLDNSNFKAGIYQYVIQLKNKQTTFTGKLIKL